MKRYLRYLFPLFFLAFWVPLSSAQVISWPYYGKNKVLYEKLDWNHYRTEHFDLYYYVDDVRILKNIAEIAESAYQKISQEMKHPLSAPVPLIFYKTYTDFEQTNLFPVTEGVLGVAEPVLHRVVTHGDMPLDEIQDVIQHELTHIFEFDLLWGSPGGALYAVTSPPDWIMEGYAEYNTEKWSFWSSMIVRDATLNDRIPELTESGSLYSRYPLPRSPDYDFGHAMFEFIESQYGKNGISEFWRSMKGSPLLGRREPVKKTFSMNNKDFNHEFKKYLRNRCKDFLLRENPEDYSITLGPEFPLNPYYFSISHALSPSGEIVAVLTQSYKDQDIDIILISTKDGSVIKNITKGFTTKYEYIRFDVDPSYGKDIAWSSDGDSIAFFARAGQRYSLFVINPMTGKTLKQISIPFDRPSAPCFSPQGEELLFTAFHKGTHDVYKVNLSTEKFLNLTEDQLFEKSPVFSPDGKKIAYTVRVDTYDKLFLSPVDNLQKKTQLTFGRGNTISPQFSPDSKLIYFSGDMREAFNIYSLSLETGALTRYTDVRTGNFFPAPVPSDPKNIIFSSFNKGALQVFKSELKGEVEKTITFVEKLPEEGYEKFEPVVSLEINEEKIQPHKGIGKLYLAARPPIDTLISSDGSVYGGSAISFSDILGDYTFSLVAYQVRSFRSYSFGYFNQKRRLQYMFQAFSYTLFYYNPMYYGDPQFYNFLGYIDAIVTRKYMGAAVAAYYPFNRYYRIESSLGYFRYEENYLDPYLAPARDSFWNGNLVSASLSLVGETTQFKYPYGPTKGNTFALSLSQSLPVSNSFIQNTTFEADLRQYFYLGSDSLFALRLFGFASRGKNPYFFYLGGNNQIRSVPFYSVLANEGWYSNLEFRFPLINAASTFIGLIGPVRGTLFFDVARTKVKGYEARFAVFEGSDPSSGLISYRTAEALGSFGYGFQLFMFGLPLHLEFAKRLEWKDFSRPFDFSSYGKFSTKFWIGFDF